MKKMFSGPTSGSAATALRLTLSLLLTAVLAVSLWVVTVPAIRAERTLTPVEMIQENLPPGRTMSSATKPEFLSAVCGAVKKHRPDASRITRVAVAAHHDYAGDIVATVLRCSSDVDCVFVQRIVSAAIAAAPSEASVIDDAALALAPDCADAIQAAAGDGKEIVPPPAEGPEDFGGGVPLGQVPLPGIIGGGVTPQEQLILVCDNGTQRRVLATDLGNFLNTHPGSFVGSCQPTPVANQ